MVECERESGGIGETERGLFGVSGERERILGSNRGELRRVRESARRSDASRYTGGSLRDHARRASREGRFWRHGEAQVVAGRKEHGLMILLRGFDAETNRDRGTEFDPVFDVEPESEGIEAARGGRIRQRELGVAGGSRDDAPGVIACEAVDGERVTLTLIVIGADDLVAAVGLLSGCEVAADGGPEPRSASGPALRRRIVLSAIKEFATRDAEAGEFSAVCRRDREREIAVAERDVFRIRAAE